MGDEKKTLKWSTLPEAELPIIRELVEFFEGKTSSVEFLADKAKVNQLIEEFILVHRKTGLDSPFLKLRRDEKRQQLFEDDDPNWELKLKRALGEAAIKNAVLPTTPVQNKTVLPLVQNKLSPEAMEKLKLLETRPLNPYPEPNYKLILIYIFCGALMLIAILAMMFH